METIVLAMFATATVLVREDPGAPGRCRRRSGALAVFGACKAVMSAT
jgi:hypothetical protein